MAGFQLEASGPSGVTPHRIMYWLGMLFVIIGAAIGIPAIVAAIVMRTFEPLVFGIMFPVLFCGIGGFFAKVGYNNMHQNDHILKQGAAYLGKIYDYEPDYRITMNGAPCVTLVVRYMHAGQIQEARVDTGDADVTKYPRGATVSIKLLNGEAAIVPGSVCDLTIEAENDLMNPDFDPSGMMSSAGVTCPNCGANITVPYGMSRFCPYCDTKVSLSADGASLES